MQKNNFCLLSIVCSDNISANLETIIDSLPFGASEAERLKKIKNPIAQKNSLASLLCLCSILASLGIDPKHDDLTIDRKAGGKPYFSSCPLHFNITHSENICAVAVSDKNIGIDLEFANTTRDISAISKRFFSSHEHSAICKDSDPYSLFFSLWTKKEAMAKLSGKGLADISSDQITERSDLFFKNYCLIDGQLVAFLSICSENKN